MFQSAIQAASEAARGWTPDRAEPSGGSQCCRLCLHRYRVLVLDGPLRDLPHGVAHAAVVAIDTVIDDRLRAAEQRFTSDVWTELMSDEDRERELSRRQRSARGSLIVVAMEELAGAEAQLSELRRCYTEPAVAGFLLHHRMNEVPEAWI